MGGKKREIYRLVLVVLIMTVLMSPIVIGNREPYYTLHEREQLIPQPASFWNGLIKHELQAYYEQRFLQKISNFRAFFVLFYNETRLHLFSTRPNNGYIWTPELGYYPVDTVKRLNNDALHHNDIKNIYSVAAHRLYILQQLLGNHGVTLIAVIPPPKVRVYPEYVERYLIASPSIISKQAISYGDVLEKNGVNTLNVQNLFLEKKSTSKWPFFATTGFHWNFWSACHVTDILTQKAERLSGRNFFKILGCDNVDYEKSKWADTDIAAILNVFSVDSIIGKTPFPRIVPQNDYQGNVPKILILGDSYSDQIVYALTQALPEMNWLPGWLIRYDSMVNRQAFGMAGNVTAQYPLNHNSALTEILNKDLFVIEVSDGNVMRDTDKIDLMEFGATHKLLDDFLRKGLANPENFIISGWREVDKGQWSTTGSIATLAIQPPQNGNNLELKLDVEDIKPSKGKPRQLMILLDDKPIGQASIVRKHQILNIAIPDNIRWQDPLVAEIKVREVSGNPLNLLLHSARIQRDGVDVKSNNVEISNQDSSDSVSNQVGIQAINFISNVEPEDVLVDGLSGLESNETESWRWALGPATRIKFYVDPDWPDNASQVLLKLAFKNGVPIQDQTVTVRLNGENVRHFSAQEIAMTKPIDTNIVLNAKKGVNVLEIAFQDWNHGKKDYGSNDPRRLAVVFMHLSLEDISQKNILN